MFWNVFLSQQTKILKQRLLWVELVGLAAIITFFAAVPYIVEEAQAAGADGMSLIEDVTFLVKLSGGAAIGGMLIVVLAGAAMGSEYGWHSVHLWLSKGVSRRVFLWGKFASLAAPLVFIPLTALAVGTPLLAFFINRRQGDLGSLTDKLPDLLASLPLTAFTMLPYAALAMLLAIVGRSTVAAIGGGLAFALVFESLIAQLLPLLGGWWAEAPGYLPSTMATSLLSMDPDGPAVLLLPRYQAAVGIALWTLLLLGLATWVFRRQDLSE